MASTDRPVVVLAATVVAAERAAFQLRLDPDRRITVCTAAHIGRLRTLRRGTPCVVVRTVHPPRWWPDATALLTARGARPYRPIKDAP